MPPVNSPARSPPRSRTPSHQFSSLTPLSWLSAPVPDLAATLQTQSESENDNGNPNDSSSPPTSFHSGPPINRLAESTLLRTTPPTPNPHTPILRESSPSPPTHTVAESAAMNANEESADDVSRRERLQRVLARLNRIHDPAASSPSSTAAYTNRDPSPNRQSLYDWAPAQSSQQSGGGTMARTQAENLANRRIYHDVEVVLDEVQRQYPTLPSRDLQALGESLILEGFHTRDSEVADAGARAGAGATSSATGRAATATSNRPSSTIASTPAARAADRARLESMRELQRQRQRHLLLALEEINGSDDAGQNGSAAATTTTNGSSSSSSSSPDARSAASRTSLRDRMAASNPGGGATESMLRYVMMRERSGLNEEEERARRRGWIGSDADMNGSGPRGGYSSSMSRERGSARGPGEEDDDEAREGNAAATWERRYQTSAASPSSQQQQQQQHLRRTSTEAWERDRQERVDAFRRGYLAEDRMVSRLSRLPTPPVPLSTQHTHAQAQNSSSHTHAHSGGATGTTTGTLAESALLYLNDLLSCESYGQAISAASDRGLATKEFFADKHDDFVSDLDGLAPRPLSTWLHPGAVFEGSQHADNIVTASLAQSRQGQRASETPHVVEQINPNFRNSQSSSNNNNTSASSQAAAAASSSSSARPLDNSHDHWPVRVIMHSVDTDTMILQGTMEAYDVPRRINGLSFPSATTTTDDLLKVGKKTAPITTYLEGHVIDLCTHTFLTPHPRRTPPNPHTSSLSSSTAGDERTNSTLATLNPPLSFPAATPKIDASNWRRLPPFDALSDDDEFARVVLSPQKLKEVTADYVFMRWKERCFVPAFPTYSPSESVSEGSKAEAGASASGSAGAGTGIAGSTARSSTTATTSNTTLADQERGHGLTISGFYYVSLRRSDGLIEGLYFDPASTPYQHLRLQGQRGGWAAVEFR